MCLLPPSSWRRACGVSLLLIASICFGHAARPEQSSAIQAGPPGPQRSSRHTSGSLIQQAAGRPGGSSEFDSIDNSLGESVERDSAQSGESESEFAHAKKSEANEEAADPVRTKDWWALGMKPSHRKIVNQLTEMGTRLGNVEKGADRVSDSFEQYSTQASRASNQMEMLDGLIDNVENQRFKHFTEEEASRVENLDHINKEEQDIIEEKRMEHKLKMQALKEQVSQQKMPIPPVSAQRFTNYLNALAAMRDHDNNFDQLVEQVHRIGSTADPTLINKAFQALERVNNGQADPNFVSKSPEVAISGSGGMQKAGNHTEDDEFPPRVGPQHAATAEQYTIEMDGGKKARFLWTPEGITWAGDAFNPSPGAGSAVTPTQATRIKEKIKGFQNFPAAVDQGYFKQEDLEDGGDKSAGMSNLDHALDGEISDGHDSEQDMFLQLGESSHAPSKPLGKEPHPQILLQMDSTDHTHNPYSFDKDINAQLNTKDRPSTEEGGGWKNLDPEGVIEQAGKIKVDSAAERAWLQMNSSGKPGNMDSYVTFAEPKKFQKTMKALTEVGDTARTLGQNAAETTRALTSVHKSVTDFGQSVKKNIGDLNRLGKTFKNIEDSAIHDLEAENQDRLEAFNNLDLDGPGNGQPRVPMGLPGGNAQNSAAAVVGNSKQDGAGSQSESAEGDD